jgi:hypothetical protein
LLGHADTSMIKNYVRNRIGKLVKLASRFYGTNPLYGTNKRGHKSLKALV